MSQQLRAPKGLYGVVVADTRIAKSSSDGSLIYSGYSIQDLAENASFDEVAFLILKGRLPKKVELDEFVAELKKHTRVPSSVYEVVRNLSPTAHPMDILRTAVSALGATDWPKDPANPQLSLAAKMATLVANCYRITNNQKVLEPDANLGFSENLLYMITGKTPTNFEAWAFERELMFYLEHDLNASSFTVRVVASTEADIYAAVTAGLAALKGPLHGGANENAMRMLLEIVDPEKAEQKVDEMLKRGEKVPGFGHRIYKKVDPRAQLSKKLLGRLLSEAGKDDRVLKLCEKIESTMWDRKKLPANLDFYAAPVFYTLGIPIQLYTPIFAASRVFGWISHYNEQLLDNKIIRPDAEYIGPKDLKYTQLTER
jgi:citrate synthase